MAAGAPISYVLPVPDEAARGCLCRGCLTKPIELRVIPSPPIWFWIEETQWLSSDQNNQRADFPGLHRRDYAIFSARSRIIAPSPKI
jgi:hypothetical protein